MSLPEAKEVYTAHEELGRYLATQPLLDRYFTHLHSGVPDHPPRNTQPWHAMGERLYAALCINMCGFMDGVSIAQYRDDPEQERVFAVGMATNLAYQAETYLWSEDMMKTALAAPLPAHVIDRDITQHRSMFFSFESCLEVRPASLADGVPPDIKVENNWLYVLTLPDSITVARDLTTSNGLVLLTYTIPFGAKFPDDFVDDAGHQPKVLLNIENTLRMLYFINSPYTAHVPGHLPRHMRREQERKTKAKAQDTVHVIVLRKPTQHTPQQQPATHSIRHYTHKWWVSGHYKAQWYPSRNAHKVIWIAPYLKGNPDDPLIEHIYKVQR